MIVKKIFLAQEDPLRSELFNCPQMIAHGQALARTHGFFKKNTKDRLLKRLDNNEKVLLEVRKVLLETLRTGQLVTPAAEWLLDNFYLIEEQIVIARKHLPKGYSQGLPSLDEGKFQGTPRVYDIVLEILSHSDGWVDAKSLQAFIQAYQTESLLTLGELWAVPIMLRLGSIENLRRVSRIVAMNTSDHNLANLWADRMIETVKEEPENLILSIADMARTRPALTGPFVAVFLRRLQDRGPAMVLVLNWLEQQLTARGTSSNDMVQMEGRNQAANQVSVRNSFGTLRFLDSTDWKDFVEGLSIVEQVLCKDPAGVYPLMDFTTRDRYRHVVEAMAKSSGLSENRVSEKVLELAQKQFASTSPKTGHVGYFLIDKGLPQCQKALGIQFPLWNRFIAVFKKFPLMLYLGAVGLLALGLAFGALELVSFLGVTQWSTLALTLILTLGVGTQTALSLVNWTASCAIKPQVLPRMDFSTAIPEAYRTLVVVPTMLSNEAYLLQQVEALEIRYLANKDPVVHFGLLTDFTDSSTENRPEDPGLLALAADRIGELNQRYGRENNDRFFLFHRPRTWNPEENLWMGYERKRGKLSALNNFLLNGSREAFSVIIGRLPTGSPVKYVITLDSDTHLPRQTAWKFIATMAHPLNQPLFSEKHRRVTEGYGILQPRVASGIPRGPVSPYLRMQGELNGIDPYTGVSSDLYQDIFNEGSFIGKGIYDVAVFEQALDGVFPENRILSHDLLEGCYLRSGLISDVLLYEDDPTRYDVDMKRHHRWIRGDWQIGAWMMPFVTNARKKLQVNPLSLLSRWKIFDNLRRSLAPGTLVGLLLLGWFLLPFPLVWTAGVMVLLMIPNLTIFLWQFFHKSKDVRLKYHTKETLRSLRDATARTLFNLTVLPYQAFKYIDGILRTLWRLYISKKHRLEWTTTAQTSRDGQSLVSRWIAMTPGPLVAIATLAGLLAWVPGGCGSAAVFLISWFLSPVLVWRLSTPEVEKTFTFSLSQKKLLNQTARKTWSYFEEFVTGQENWLPPDNYQEEPVPVTAHRTSPTNMGLTLLAYLGAWDFGYLPGGALVERCFQTLDTMGNLEKFKGHFLNWYDTQSLSPLSPRYVSTVDSGNLAGHLMVLRQGLLNLPSRPVISRQFLYGLRTTFGLIDLKALRKNDKPLKKILAILENTALNLQDLGSVWRCLADLSVQGGELTGPGSWEGLEPDRWLEKFNVQVKGLIQDLELCAPWVKMLPVPEVFPLLTILESTPSWDFISKDSLDISGRINTYLSQSHSLEDLRWLATLAEAWTRGHQVAQDRQFQIVNLSQICEEWATPDYDFLFDKATSLLAIGYNVEEQRRDSGFYDLLASEARLGLFVAIALGSLPQESWFALGRLLTKGGGEPILLSWSGSMFEYLMPNLVMPTFRNTLIYQTNKSMVKSQKEYGMKRGTPWGISESAYHMVDANMNFQYKAFGVPGIGLKRGLEEDLVVAPYATLLALLVSPMKACVNLQRLLDEGMGGEYGFYEAVDYTPSRLPRGKDKKIVPSYMVHHQGMGFLSLAYVLLEKPMQERFAMDLRFQSALLLLQEKIPREVHFYKNNLDPGRIHQFNTPMPLRRITTPHTRIPEIQLLGNSQYQVMITNSGGGYSRWKDLAVTRWREDVTQDNWGSFCYIKDVVSGKIWSNTHQPTLVPAKNFEAIFSQGHGEFRRQDFGIITKTEIVVSPEDDTELRRVRLTNNTASVRTLEITSYAEVVLATQGADEAHRAFSNLFVQTEILPEFNAILCTRRPRSKEENPPWMFHLMGSHGAVVEDISYETDRLAFVGRGRTLANPRALENSRLPGTQGPVLDPVVAIRYRLSLKPHQTAVVELIYGMTDTRESCEALIHKYLDRNMQNRAFELSWTHSQVLLRQIGASESEAQLFNRLAGSLVFLDPAFRPESGVIQSNQRGQSGLWSHSVSGDLPLVLLHINDPQNMDLVRQLIRAHAYWRLKGLAVDLVIWNENHGLYRQELQQQIQGLVFEAPVQSSIHGKSGKIFVKSADQISPEDRILFKSVARVIIQDTKGSLEDQLNRDFFTPPLPPTLNPKFPDEEDKSQGLSLPSDLQFFNGTGGFTSQGTEYQIISHQEEIPPAPWVNVLANPRFGSVVSQSGSSYTWAENAHEYRLTPWNNDPVMDSGGEALYLRDEDSGGFWSPSPFPVQGKTPYITTHGFGTISFDHEERGISTELQVFVHKDLPVKFLVLKVKNQSGRWRKLSATGYIEAVLGTDRSKTSQHIITEFNVNLGAILIRNPYNTAFSEWVTFFRVLGGQSSFTSDRGEFIGRNGNLSNPGALGRKHLSGRTGASLDPCAALQVKFDLPDGGEKEIIFQLGNEVNRGAAVALLERFALSPTVRDAHLEVKKYWSQICGTIEIETPDKALNILAKGWLVYQTIACRLFARSGFYQSGGAFGFRDQLQDGLALLPIRPDFARQQILLSASRQFTLGDVQHWWHPPEGRGVRTRCSDDLLWLPYAVTRYLHSQDDPTFLTTQVGFLQARDLLPEEESLYNLPDQAEERTSLYDHCTRAISQSLKFGVHGLPLIGSGDWNDGMDQVGVKGQGESVWLAFFLYEVLMKFAPLAQSVGDDVFAELCLSQAATLQGNIEASAWDGKWYKRAWFDDGHVLGSEENQECRIDAIAQSWSVLSGAGGDLRQIQAMASLDDHLVNRDLKLIQLLTPPFNGEGPNPGYIQGYVPGVRENGGQYSHGAIWALMAFAQLGQAEKAWELFSLILPINHALTPQAVDTYKVEPYVMAADVYANPSHKGRGGWTWYTGSAGWMQQFIIGSLIGMDVSKNRLVFTPCFPRDWPSVALKFLHGTTTYSIKITQVPGEAESWWNMDGVTGKGNAFDLVDDGLVHVGEVFIKVR